MNLSSLQTTINVVVDELYIKVRDRATLSKADLRQEAWLVVLQAIKNYDPKRAKLNTYIEKCIRRHFIKLLQRQNSTQALKNDQHPTYNMVVEDHRLFTPDELEILRIFNSTENIAVMVKLLNKSRTRLMRQIMNLCEKLKS